MKDNSITLTMIFEEVAQVTTEGVGLCKIYCVIVLPEGLVEFMLDVEALVVHLNEILVHSSNELSKWDVHKSLQPNNC